MSETRTLAAILAVDFLDREAGEPPGSWDVRALEEPRKRAAHVCSCRVVGIRCGSMFSLSASKESRA
jgi:hypothetical protein